MPIEFELPDMSCQHCVRVVTETVKHTDPHAVLHIDLPEHRVTIDSQRPAQEFARALEQAGYPCR